MHADILVFLLVEGSWAQQTSLPSVMTDLIPNCSVEEIYSPRSVQDERVRWSSLTEHFRHTFHNEPQFIARAPGRLNMIGECVQEFTYE